MGPGGPPPVGQPPPAVQDCAGFEFVASATLTRLQGEWTPVRIVRDGQELPKAMLAGGRRSATKNEGKIVFGGEGVVYAFVRIDERTGPNPFGYFKRFGAAQRTGAHRSNERDRR